MCGKFCIPERKATKTAKALKICCIMLEGGAVQKKKYNKKRKRVTFADYLLRKEIKLLEAE